MVFLARVVKAVIGRFLRRLERAEHAELVTIAGEREWHSSGFRMRSCGARDQVACTASALGWRAFEAPMPGYFAQAVLQAEDGVIVDVGANTGFYTLLALAVSGSVTVVAYEPLPSVRHILAANLRLNPASDRVNVHPYAVSNASGPRTLFVPDAGHGLIETSASLSADFKGGTAADCTVETTTLDSMHLGAPRVAVLKIDAESHDQKVLEGAVAVLMRDRPVVFVEVLFGADEHGLTAVLDRCGYLDFVLRQDRPAEPRREVRHETDAWNHMWIPREKAANPAWTPGAMST